MGDGTGEIDAGHTAWILISCALVNFMTPGLAFFYGGLVRRNHVLSIIIQNYVPTPCPPPSLPFASTARTLRERRGDGVWVAPDAIAACREHEPRRC